MSGTPRWCRYVLIIDHADVLFTPSLEGCLEPLAELLAAGAPGSPLGLLAAGGRLSREMLRESGMPLRSLRPLLLGALRESEAVALIRVGNPEMEESEVQALQQLSGRHPYVLQCLLCEMEKAGFKISAKNAVRGAAARIQALFAAIWAEFDLGRGVTYRGAYAAPEHAFMQLLIDREQEVDLRLAEHDLGIKPLKEYAEFLEYVGVIERVLRGNTFLVKAGFSIWNSWYRERLMR